MCGIIGGNAGIEVHLEFIINKLVMAENDSILDVFPPDGHVDL